MRNQPKEAGTMFDKRENDLLKICRYCKRFSVYKANGKARCGVFDIPITEVTECHKLKRAQI
jgi:hypothetical protein